MGKLNSQNNIPLSKDNMETTTRVTTKTTTGAITITRDTKINTRIRNFIHKIIIKMTETTNSISKISSLSTEPTINRAMRVLRPTRRKSWVWMLSSSKNRNLKSFKTTQLNLFPRKFRKFFNLLEISNQVKMQAKKARKSNTEIFLYGCRLTLKLQSESFKPDE